MSEEEYKALVSALYLIHRENLALMRMLSYPKQEEKIKEYEKEFMGIFENGKNDE